MYFIRRGEVEVISTEGDHLTFLSEGGFFGEIAVLFNTKRTASVNAVTYCDLYVLAKEDLDSVLTHYPEQKALMLHSAKIRISQVRKIFYLFSYLFYFIFRIC